MNKENFTISVIFPTLNEGENLKFLIPDFISEFNNLGIQDYELIVVDDGSSDGTENILFQFKCIPYIFYHFYRKSKVRRIKYLN